MTEELYRTLTAPERLQARINRLRLEREEIMAAVENAAAIRTDGSKVQTSPRSDAIPKALANAEEKDNEIAGLELRRQLAISRRSQLLSKLTDPRGETLLSKRYIEQKSWQTIAEDMGYTIRQCYRIRNDAIAELEKMSLNVT